MAIPSNIRVWKVCRQDGKALAVEAVCLGSSLGGGEPVIRYLLTFQIGEKNRLRVVAKQFFNERGMLESDSLSFAVPKSVYNPMVRLARAIFSESR